MSGHLSSGERSARACFGMPSQTHFKKRVRATFRALPSAHIARLNSMPTGEPDRAARSAFGIWRPLTVADFGWRRGGGLDGLFSLSAASPVISGRFWRLCR